MKVIDEELLASMRGPGPCERCGVQCSKRDVAHAWSRGAGRVDIRCNLLSVGSWMTNHCRCHPLSGALPEIAQEFREIAAKREKMTAERAKNIVDRIRRAPKGCSLCSRCKGIDGLDCSECHGSGILNHLGEGWKG